MEFPHPLMVCDIGATNVRAAFLHAAGAQPILLPPQLTADFPDFTAYAEKIIGELGERPLSVIACGAGPVIGRSLNLTNATWALDGPKIAYQLSLSQGLLLNDFEAQALSVPVLRPEWLRMIGPALPKGQGPRLILGPGTGLGVAAFISHGDRHFALASEAAHAEFAPVDESERALWAVVARAHGRITAETLVSGPGLARLHQARSIVFEFAAAEPDGPSVVASANENRMSPAAETIRHFWRLVARLSGDLALTFLAQGGVTLSGGILPRISNFLDAELFRQNFEAKVPMEKFLRALPTELLESEDAVLIGMTSMAAHPKHYAIDYAARAWR